MPLFGGFLGNMRPSDFPQAYMPDVRSATFSGRSTTPGADARGISRFPCKEFPRMRRFSDCAGFADGLPVTPLAILPSAWVNSVGTPETVITQLDGWPACAPVNASTVALRPLSHDSETG